jgi:hypothetical protein
MNHGCCGSLCNACPAGVTRRGFLAGAGSVSGLAAGSLTDPVRQAPIKLPLRVQPVFVWQIKTRQPATSWRTTAEIHTEEEAAAERERIGRDLAGMAARAEFPLEVLPLATVHDTEQAAALSKGAHDVLIMYAAGWERKPLEALARPDKWNLIFVRHKSGRIYYMYIGVHPHFLRKTTDDYGQPGMDVDDVVVDSHLDLLWRLRALYGLKNTLGKRIVAVGSAGGWGADGRNAPERARARFKLDIRTVSYPDLEARLKKAAADAALLGRAQQATGRFLADKGVRLETSKDFVSRAFILTEVFRDILAETNCDAITIGGCMRTILPISETTACLPLSILNDEGYLAFCESDFVAIPSGILLHYISGKPVFLCNASFPYDGIVTVSHCTAPRRMDGNEQEPARILTHYESDYGAAPKVEMRKGQQVTVLDPDFAGRRWLGFAGEITATPFYPICRTQLEVAVKGDTAQLARQLRGFHWMVCYGDYLRETSYALKKAGVDWLAAS